MDWGQSIAMWGTIIIFNLAILQLLRVTLAHTDFQAAMKEKAPPIATETTTVQQAPVVGAEPVVMEKKVSEHLAAPETSYSRVAGMIGAVVLACFVWAVGNVLLYKMFASTPQEVTALLASLGSYFLAGASLFAPYAVNQLSSAFRSK